MAQRTYAVIVATLGIAITEHAHPPVATVEEARRHWDAIDAVHTKNLLLKDEAKAFWLVAMPAEMSLDLKALPKAIGSKRLRFDSANDLDRLLGVVPGAVSPLALANDRDRTVKLALHDSLLQAPLLAFHPLRNDVTVTLTPADLLRYLAATGHEPVSFVST